MPTYDYECSKCKKDFELVQSMKDDALKTCPEAQCRQKKWGHGAVKRKLGSGAGFIFKGSGFYITDYRSEGYKSKAKSDSASSNPTPAATPAASPAPAKSESKPKSESTAKAK